MKSWSGLAVLVLLVVFLLPGTAQAVALIHLVQPGETLDSIARHYGTSPDILAQINGLQLPLALQAGQRLLIWGSAPADQVVELVAEQALADEEALVGTLQAPAGPSLLSCTVWPAPGEPLAARVNGWGIGLEAFERRWVEVVAGLKHVGIDTDGRLFQESADRARAGLLSRLVDEVLVQQGALAQGIMVDGHALAARLEAEVSTPGRRQRFEAWLAQTGQTWDGYRLKLCQTMLAEALVSHVGRTLAGPDQAEALERWLASRRAQAATEVYIGPAGRSNSGSVAGADGLLTAWVPVITRQH